MQPTSTVTDEHQINHAKTTLNQKKIAVIGAGWAGIGCSTVLKEAGHHLDIYEKRNDIGGVWHPDNEYAGLMIHQASRGIEYFDVPISSHIDKTERILAEQVFDYLRKYCEIKKLYDHLHFNVEVVKISYDSKNKKAILHFIDQHGSKRESVPYDYVIYTNGFSNRAIPEFVDVEKFSGQVIHSFAANHECVHSFIRQNKKITVLGASKTATDMIIHFYRCGYKVDWLYRKPYWFFRFDPHNQLLKARSQGKIHNKFFYRLLIVFGYYTAPKFPNLVFVLWRMFRVIHTFNKKHADFNSFHLGWLDDGQMKILRAYNQAYGIEGEIEKFEQNGFRLKDGRFIKSDVVICCTGSGDKSGIELELDHKPFPLAQVHKVYRGRVIPQLPNLFFTAHHFFSLGTVNGLNNGHWIARYIDDNLSEQWLCDHSVDHGYSFFLQQPLFQSKKNVFAMTKAVTEEFFRSGELNRFSYVKWFFSKYAFGYEGPRPLTFKSPKK